MVPKEQGEAGFVDGTGSEFEDGLRRFGFGGGEVQAVAFEEYVAGHETSSLVSVDERMILHDSNHISGGQYQKIAFGVGENLAWTGQGGFKQPCIPQACGTAVLGLCEPAGLTPSYL